MEESSSRLGGIFGILSLVGDWGEKKTVVQSWEQFGENWQEGLLAWKSTEVELIGGEKMRDWAGVCE